MFTKDVKTKRGDVVVETTQNKGLSPEYWTERIVNKIVSISDHADPMVKAQAQAFKESIQAVILLYIKQAIANDRAPKTGLVKKQGHKDMGGEIGGR